LWAALSGNKKMVEAKAPQQSFLRPFSYHVYSVEPFISLGSGSWDQKYYQGSSTFAQFGSLGLLIYRNLFGGFVFSYGRHQLSPEGSNPYLARNNSSAQQTLFGFAMGHYLWKKRIRLMAHYYIMNRFSSDELTYKIYWTGGPAAGESHSGVIFQGSGLYLGASAKLFQDWILNFGWMRTNYKRNSMRTLLNDQVYSSRDGVSTNLPPYLRYDTYTLAISFPFDFRFLLNN
jgi:hypothetical protein